MKELLDHGLEPEIAEMTAYFPSITHGIPILPKKISSAADVAVVKGNLSGLGATAVSKKEAAACEMVLLAVPWDNVLETLASLPKWNNRIGTLIAVILAAAADNWSTSGISLTLSRRCSNNRCPRSWQHRNS